MMSKTEIKEEAKQAEGSPEAKGAVKQRQRASARRRMMAAVPRATVVVTNPTHFAIALEWDEATMAAPVLVAKGADLMAKRIREVAARAQYPDHGKPAARADASTTRFRSIRRSRRTCTPRSPRSSPSFTNSRTGRSPR